MKHNIRENLYSFVLSVQMTNQPVGQVIKTFIESKLKYKTPDSVWRNEYCYALGKSLSE